MRCVCCVYAVCMACVWFVYAVCMVCIYGVCMVCVSYSVYGVSNPKLCVCCNREQLGGNKFLVSDGIFMAKALNRTFVEYPVRDSR